MLQLMQHLLVTVVAVIVPISLGLWVWQGVRVARGQPMLEAIPRPAVPWSLVDLVVILLTGFAVLAFSQWWFLRHFDLPPNAWDLADLNPAQQVRILMSFSLSSLITGLVAIGVCSWRSQATPADLGWNGAYWRGDVAMGGAAFAMLIVPVLLIHFLAQRLLPTDESHPFVDLIMDDPRVEYLVPIALAALLAAPLVEELFFRVLLQGWLERLAADSETRAQREVESTVPPEDSSVEGDRSTAIDELKQAAMDDSPDSRPHPEGSNYEGKPEGLTGGSAAADCPPASRPSRGLPDDSRLRWAAIVISSLCFALAHFGQGPAPLSLFVLALGLGYLYQRTHRILPGIVVHFLVNFTAICQLALAIAEQQP